MSSEQIDPIALLESELRDHIHLTTATNAAVAAPFSLLVNLTLEGLANNRKLLLFGNGGSAAQAQHWATELTVRFRRDRPAIPALSLTCDSSALTAIGNDFGFEKIFARQIEALASPGDLAIGISTSGNSPNVVAGLTVARTLGCKTVAFTGQGGGQLANLADVALMVPSTDTARIQEMHAVLGHVYCAAIETAVTSHARVEVTHASIHRPLSPRR